MLLLRDSFEISVNTYHVSPLAGGAGVFTIIAEDDFRLELSWESDSTAIITYPRGARIVRNEDSTYYFGRYTYFEQEPED